MLEKVLKLYIMRIRGKDAVKTLVSGLKQSAIANSLRGKLAATAAANDKSGSAALTTSMLLIWTQLK